jgi:hypothetical protein
MIQSALQGENHEKDSRQFRACLHFNGIHVGLCSGLDETGQFATGHDEKRRFHEERLNEQGQLKEDQEEGQDCKEGFNEEGRQQYEAGRHHEERSDEAELVPLEVVSHCICHPQWHCHPEAKRGILVLLAATLVPAKTKVPRFASG